VSACATHECCTQVFLCVTERFAYTSKTLLGRGCRHYRQRRNSQAKGCCGDEPFRRLAYGQGEELICETPNERADSPRRAKYCYAACLVKVRCTNMVLMTVYPDVIKIDNGGPLHVGAEQHHANHKTLTNDIPVVHRGISTLETEPRSHGSDSLRRPNLVFTFCERRLSLLMSNFGDIFA